MLHLVESILRLVESALHLVESILRLVELVLCLVESILHLVEPVYVNLSKIRQTTAQLTRKMADISYIQPSLSLTTFLLTFLWVGTIKIALPICASGTRIGLSIRLRSFFFG